ncbi:MAG TPA: hypothetical protein VFE32_02425 [Puia sp.]|jgi:hypothetical protein|nr:hypothetical protein [Puia sp.]
MYNVYNAFLSYSHSDCRNIAPYVQRGVEHVGKPWYKVFSKGLTVFRDETNLTATPNLWESVKKAVLASENFILLASPMAAQSKWVIQEVDVWIEKEKSETGNEFLNKLIIVVCKGDIGWKGKDFDWKESVTNCLPPNLAGKFSGEPLWIDLRYPEEGEEKDKVPYFRTFEFAEKIAKVIGAIIGKPQALIISRELQRIRKIATFLVFAAALFITLSVLATVFYVGERKQTHQVTVERDSVIESQKETQRQKDTAVRNLKSYMLAKFVSDLNNGKRLYEAEDYDVAKRFFLSADSIAKDTITAGDETVQRNLTILKTDLMNCEKFGRAAK